MANAMTMCSDMAVQLAHDAHADYCRLISPPMYVYLLPRGDGSFNPVLRRDGASVDGLTIGVNEMVPRHMTQQQMVAWFNERLRRLPIIPVNA